MDSCPFILKNKFKYLTLDLISLTKTEWMFSYVKWKWKSLSCVWLFATPQTVVQVPPSMEFSRQEYWSGMPFPSPEDLPDPGTEPGSPALQADSLPFEPPGSVCVCLVAQSCPTLCDPVHCSLPGSSVCWIFRQESWSRLPFPAPGESSWARIWTRVSCTGRHPGPLWHLRSPLINYSPM